MNLLKEIVTCWRETGLKFTRGMCWVSIIGVTLLVAIAIYHWTGDFTRAKMDFCFVSTQVVSFVTFLTIALMFFRSLAEKSDETAD